MNKAGYDIGFDVGGSHIAGALFSGEKELMRLQTPYPKNEPDKASGIIAQMIEALADAIPEAAEDKLSLLNVVGIAVPGSISRDKRTVLNAYNLGFKNHPLPELIERKLNSRVRVLMANDADAAAWAEYMRGSLRLRKQCAYNAGHRRWRRNNTERFAFHRRHGQRRGAGAFYNEHGRGRKMLLRREGLL